MDPLSLFHGIHSLYLMGYSLSWDYSLPLCHGILSLSLSPWDTSYHGTQSLSRGILSLVGLLSWDSFSLSHGIMGFSRWIYSLYVLRPVSRGTHSLYLSL